MRLTAKLSEITTVFADWDWIESKDQSSKWIRLIQTWNVWIWNFKDRWDKARYISEETFDRLNCTEIFPNDCLVSRLPDPVWRSCLIPELPDRLITAVDCTIIRFKDTIEPKFFVYYSQSNQYQRDVDILCTWATRKRISRKSLWTIEIPLPPLETQKAMVAKLDQIFAELDQTKSEIQKNLDNTDELWKSALNQAFQGDWEMKKLGEVCENFDNQRKPVTAGDRKKWTYPYYWASWIVDYVDNYIYDWDYLLVSEDWANLLARSTPIAFSISWKNWVNNHAHVLKFWNITTQLFVERFLNFIDLSDYVTWSAQPKLNQKNLNDIEIPVPQLSEQEKIVEHLDQVSKEVKALKSQYQSQLDNLEELKKSVLDKAFRWEMAE